MTATTEPRVQVLSQWRPLRADDQRHAKDEMIHTVCEGGVAVGDFTDKARAERYAASLSRVVAETVRERIAKEIQRQTDACWTNCCVAADALIAAGLVRDGGARGERPEAARQVHLLWHAYDVSGAKSEQMTTAFREAFRAINDLPLAIGMDAEYDAWIERAASSEVGAAGASSTADSEAEHHGEPVCCNAVGPDGMRCTRPMHDDPQHIDGYSDREDNDWRDALRSAPAPSAQEGEER